MVAWAMAAHNQDRKLRHADPLARGHEV